VAAVLAQKGVTVNRIECSAKERAMETADILAGALGIAEKVTVRDGLKPEDPVQIVLDELKEGCEDRMLVGHMPYMPRMLEALLGSVKEAGRFVFTTATVVCVTGEPGRSWKVEWIESP
jgi:phosphohistidine phosphatase